MYKRVATIQYFAEKLMVTYAEKHVHVELMVENINFLYLVCFYKNSTKRQGYENFTMQKSGKNNDKKVS